MGPVHPGFILNAATDSTFFQTLDNDLWMDTIGAALCLGVLAAVLLRLVLKAILPVFRRV